MIDFDLIAREEGPQAERLAQWFAAHHAGEMILDVGCGPGIYVQAMRQRGLDAFGVDSDPRLIETEYLWRSDIVRGEGVVGGPVREYLSRFHVVLSLEVGEHISAEDAGAYLDYLTQGEPAAIYFSAARPGQGGSGHVNCQIKAYWLRLFCARGYYFHPEATEAFLTYLRQGPHMGWLLQNGMVLERGDR